MQIEGHDPVLDNWDSTNREQGFVWVCDISKQDQVSGGLVSIPTPATNLL